MFKFLLIFFIDIITSVISSTQIACDAICVQHLILYFFYFFFYEMFFSVDHGFYLKNTSGASHLNQI